LRACLLRGGLFPGHRLLLAGARGFFRLPRRAAAGSAGVAAGTGFDLLAPDDEQLADHLDRRAAQSAAQLLHDRDPALTVVAVHADLDQAVGAQRAVGLGQHRRGEAGIADRHHRVEVMRFGPQRLAVGAAQFWNRPPGGCE